MKITNNFNLPQLFVDIVEKRSYKPREGRFSVTKLTSPPQINFLTLKHYDEIETDVSEYFWMFLGEGVHLFMEKYSPANALSEEKIEYIHNNKIIVGKSDLYYNQEIIDYKCTSVYSFLLGEKKEWVAQINIYRWLYEKLGFPVNKLFIYAILRDWMKSKTYKNEDYPKAPFFVSEIPLWTLEKTEEYIDNSLEENSGDNPRQCTAEEKWSEPTRWAVMKIGRKTAIRVLETEEEAKTHKKTLLENQKMYIEKREGKNKRCEDYCNVAEFCEQRKIENQEVYEREFKEGE